MCEIQEKLRQRANNLLEQIDSINRAQIEALKNRDDSTLMRLDKELELVFGEKERAFGALHEHRDEHGC